MSRRTCSQPPVETEATVHGVDPVTRELGAVIAGVPVSIYVPSKCDIVLRGERVKLRMVQSGDRVRVTYTGRGKSLTAHHVEVQPGCPPSLPS